MTLVLFYEQRARLAGQVQGTGDKDGVFGRDCAQFRDGFSGRMGKASAWSLDIFGRYGS